MHNNQILISLFTFAIFVRNIDVRVRYNIPRIIANTGTAFLTLVRIPILMNFPNTEAANIAGTVPSPNRIITAAPEIKPESSTPPRTQRLNKIVSGTP